MKNVRVKVKQSCGGTYYDIGLFEGHKLLMCNPMKSWLTPEYAIRNAKAMAKRIGIKYDPEIIKQHGC